MLLELSGNLPTR
ncbi:hypothetical protein LINPERPRIM_LOCUS40028 [Linum perenne]